MRPLRNIPYSALRAKQKPYWSFWKVVFAGWLIRYPKIFFVPLGFLLAIIYNALTK